jgi:hypothetical protein
MVMGYKQGLLYMLQWGVSSTLPWHLKGPLYSRLAIDEYGAMVERSLTAENRSDKRKPFSNATKSTPTEELNWD